MILLTGEGFSAAHLRISLLADVGSQPLAITNSAGAPLDPNSVTLPLKVQAAVREIAAPSHPVEYHFGEGIVLSGYDLQNVPEKNQVQITLHWKAVKGIGEDYVIFTQLRDAPDHLYAQNDSPPRQGWYPISLWESGEVILDEHEIRLPSPTTPALDLYLGLYDPVTGVRLPAFDAQGNPLVNAEVKLAPGLRFP